MPENSINFLENKRIKYRKCVFTLKHSLYRLAGDIYPLSKERFKKMGVERHAAYSYIGDINESTFKISKWLIEELNIKALKERKDRFNQTWRLGIFPKDLSDSLIKLNTLRNRIYHQDDDINENLIAYSWVGKVIIIGYATYEIAATILDWKLKQRRGTIIVDNGYLEREVEKYNVWGVPPSEIHTKIGSDHILLSIKINFEDLRILINRYPNLLTLCREIGEG
jgi:uncharacterized protein YutE (UPF0331/DUF86 family)